MIENVDAIIMIAEYQCYHNDSRPGTIGFHYDVYGSHSRDQVQAAQVPPRNFENFSNFHVTNRTV